jgi:hypothetical protein
LVEGLPQLKRPGVDEREGIGTPAGERLDERREQQRQPETDAERQLG